MGSPGHPSATGLLYPPLKALSHDLTLVGGAAAAASAELVYHLFFLSDGKTFLPTNFDAFLSLCYDSVLTNSDSGICIQARAILDYV